MEASLTIHSDLQEDIIGAQSKDGSSNLTQSILELSIRDIRVGWPQYNQLKPYLHGWFRPGNLALLSRLLPTNAQCVIELGAWLGRSTKYLCERCPDALIFSVDLWSNDYFETDSHYDKADPEFSKILHNHSIYDQFLSNLSSHGLTDDGKGLVPMKMDSTEALRIIHNLGANPDLIYIDASHHYDFVVKDIKMCLDLFPNAVLVGDDWDNEDVRLAVEHVAHERKLSIYVQGKTCWTYSRSKVLAIIEEERLREAEHKEQQDLVKEIRSKRGFDIEAARSILKRSRK